MSCYGHRFPVEIINEQDHIFVNESKIRFICSKIISDAGFRTGRLGVIFTDNVVIRALNRQYLKHDNVTNIISFDLECTDTHLVAELVVSTEMVKECYLGCSWNKESELILCVIQGVLYHVVCYDNQTENDVRLMRRMEAKYLGILGIVPKPTENTDHFSDFLP